MSFKAALKQHLLFEFQNLKAVCYFYIKSNQAQAYCDYWMGGMLQKMFGEVLFTLQQKTAWTKRSVLEFKNCYRFIKMKID